MAKLTGSILAVKFQASTVVTVPGGVFTFAAGDVSALHPDADVPGGTVLGVMYNSQSAGGQLLDVFRLDSVMTV